ncbi:MAG: cytochrome c3 family protein [Desulfovibrio sp.]|jgi:fumarate reductase flavoprotein subunit|nr:cytochrome c3 family protein [Desulfovibrio sp.]
MKHTILHFFLLLAAVIPLSAGVAAAQQPLGKCATDCHTDIQAVLPKNHMTVEGEDNISSCMQCHLPSSETLKDTRVFSAKVHKKHFGEKKLQCSYCHIIQKGVSFALPGRESIGVPDEQTLGFLPEITAEWAQSPFLSAVHSAKDVACSPCHGVDKLPLLDDKPANNACFACHVSYEQLAAKTPGKDHPTRNPHNSHLGPINCTVCHKAHEVSVNYCLDCHKFDMNPIPAGKQ